MAPQILEAGCLFPGQGSQFVGMGKDLCESYPTAKTLWEQANEILEYDIQSIAFNGPEDKLTQTRYAQPAIFVTSMIAWAILKEKHPEFKPLLCAGLSLGEFSALVAAGSITFEDGLKLVQKRADAMEKSAQNNPGTMASIIGLSEADCQDIASQVGCQVANLNAPDQIVLSGKLDAIEKACKLAEEKGAKRAIPLKVGGAFHSELMREAKDDLEKALRETKISEPVCTFIPNVKGAPVSDSEEIRALLAMQLMSSVQWVRSMDTAMQQSIITYLEIGPGKVLKGLARRCHRELQVQTCGTVDDMNAVDALFLNHH